MTRPIFKLLRTSPSDMTSHDKGLAIAKTRIVGASKRKIGVAASTLAPEKRKSFARKKSTGQGYGHGHCQDHGVALQEVIPETTRIVL